MNHFNYIITGGGAAGLSLALAIAQSDLPRRSVLIIDREPKIQNDRTWCFWTDQPTGLESITHRSWSQIRFQSETFNHTYALGNTSYHLIRGADFYEYARKTLRGYANIEWVQGEVDSIMDDPKAPVVKAAGSSYSADFVFDSILKPGDFVPQPKKYHYLKQHFLGWTIETNQPAFDPLTPILFDFRTPQNGAMRFMYTLPFSSTSALIEYTLFSETLLSQAEYELALKEYIENVLNLHEYRVHETEKGVIPMTDHIFPRRAGQRVLHTGTKGGLVKPSSGYAFWRIQNDSKSVVKSLLQYQHPFHIPTSSFRYRWFDTILLQIMRRHPDECANLFTILFKNNPIHRIFRFLDEDGDLYNDLRILSSLPPYRFLEAFVRVKLFKII